MVGMAVMSDFEVENLQSTSPCNQFVNRKVSNRLLSRRILLIGDDAIR